MHWIQPGLKFVTASKCTMAAKWSNRVEIFGKGDKREMKVLLSVTFTGMVLLTQLIYQGVILAFIPPGCGIFSIQSATGQLSTR